MDSRGNMGRQASAKQMKALDVAEYQQDVEFYSELCFSLHMLEQRMEQLSTALLDPPTQPIKQDEVPQSHLAIRNQLDHCCEIRAEMQAQMVSYAHFEMVTLEEAEVELATDLADDQIAKDYARETVVLFHSQEGKPNDMAPTTILTPGHSALLSPSAVPEASVSHDLIISSVLGMLLQRHWRGTVGGSAVASAVPSAGASESEDLAPKAKVGYQVPTDRIVQWIMLAASRTDIGHRAYKYVLKNLEQNDDETLVSENAQPPMSVRISAASVSVTVHTCLKNICIDSCMEEQDGDDEVHDSGGGGGMFSGTRPGSRMMRKGKGNLFGPSPTRSYANFGSKLFKGSKMARSRSEGDETQSTLRFVAPRTVHSFSKAPTQALTLLTPLTRQWGMVCSANPVRG